MRVEKALSLDEIDRASVADDDLWAGGLVARGAVAARPVLTDNVSGA
jgi:hypothetical protein